MDQKATAAKSQNAPETDSARAADAEDGSPETAQPEERVTSEDNLAGKNQASKGAAKRSRAREASSEDARPAAARRAARKAAADASREQGGAPQVIEIRPMAGRAKMRSRHWGLLLAFILMVAAPVGGIGFYLYGIATDQYASSSGFSVRSEEVGAPSEMLGGISQLMGGSSDKDTDMLYQFIQSQDLVTKLEERMNLRAHYTAPYQTDPFFALKPGGTVEDLVDYWQRVVKVSYDQSTGLIDLNVRAFTPEMAQHLSEEIIVESQVLVNALNATARADMLKYAEQDLADAVVRLKNARQALVEFRTRTQIVDPESDLQGRMGVLNSLQQQLAQALIDYDLVVQDSSDTDPRVITSARRIEVIRERIKDERRTFAEDQSGEGSEGYPTLLAEYEGLSVDREFAEEAYRAALASLDIAKANAARQSRYLATYLRPTLAERPEYPQRGVILGLSALFLVLFWTISSLMFYALRDRK